MHWGLSNVVVNTVYQWKKNRPVVALENILEVVHLRSPVIRGLSVEIDRVNYWLMFTQQNICPVQYPTLMLVKPESGNVQWKQNLVLFLRQHKQQLQRSVRGVIRNTTAYQ